MSVEITSAQSETFEFAVTSDGCVLTGTGRLRALAVAFGEGWLTPHALADGVGITVENVAGVVGTVRVTSGVRMRLDVALENEVGDVIEVDGPVLSAAGERPVIGWIAGASGELVLPGPDGPGLLAQRRGLCVPGSAPGEVYPLGEVVTVAPRQLVTAAWTYETFAGDLLDVPAEHTDLPLARYVPVGETVEFSAPDGMVTFPDATRLAESDGEFVLDPEPGLTQLQLWGIGGATLVEVGAYEDLSTLRGRATALRGSSDTWCYVAVRHLLEGEIRDDIVDRIDWLLAEAEESPSAWTACAAALAVNLDLPLWDVAMTMATRVLERPTADDVLLLALHGLISAEEAMGRWPVGDFDRVGLDAVAALRYGRIHTDSPRETGRDVAVARLWAAGLGESERGLRAAAYAQAAEARLLCHLSVRPDLTDLAWLSVN